MKISAFLFLSLTFCALLSACDQVTNSATQGSRLTAVESRLVDAQSAITKLQSEVAKLKQRRELDELTKGWEKIAYHTPGADGYSTVAFDLGVLTVQLTDVKPYANGSKVTLKFGNTLSCSINGLKATIEWGKVNHEGVPDNDNAKAKSMTFVQTLRGGAWTPIPMVLDGIPPSELGFVRVSKVSHAGIQLAP